MRDRKPVERSGVADPISERWGRQHITHVEVRQGHICVAVVVCGEEMCSSTFCLVTVVRQAHQPWFDRLANQSENALWCFNSVDFCATSLRHFDRLSDRWLSDRHPEHSRI